MFATIWSVLSSSLLFWEIAGYVCTFAVILGCVGEYIAEFTGIPKSNDQQHRISKLSLIVLTVGIAGELLTAIRSSQISGEVIADLQTSVSTARQSAADAADAAERANAAAGDAKTKADAVGVEADQARTKIAGVDRRADVLAYFLSARRVRDESGLESDLREKFKGEHITFDSYVGDEEAYWLCSQLAEIARKAGVDSKDECAAKQLLMRLPITDLHISAPTIEESQRLSILLKKPKRVPGYFVGFNVAPEVTVTVGAKPSIPLFPMVNRASNKTSAKP